MPRGTSWCVHKVLDVPARDVGRSWEGCGTSGLLLVRDPPLARTHLRDFLSYLQLFSFDCFSEPLRNVFFPILAPKTLPKWRPKSTKIDEKVVSTGLSKNVPRFDDIFLFFWLFVKRSMATKHCKYQYKTTFFASPRDAPRFTKNVKKRSKKHPKIL